MPAHRIGRLRDLIDAGLDRQSECRRHAAEELEEQQQADVRDGGEDDEDDHEDPSRSRFQVLRLVFVVESQHSAHLKGTDGLNAMTLGLAVTSLRSSRQL